MYNVISDKKFDITLTWPVYPFLLVLFWQLIVAAVVLLPVEIHKIEIKNFLMRF
jgi:hypothetical protein